MKYSRAFALSVVAASMPAVAGPDWVEHKDAGSDYSTAQAIIGIGTPQRISGSLSTGLTGGDYEDIYIIRIETPTLFSFTMENSQFDSQLYLFNITLASQLFGLLSNNDATNLSPEAAIYQSTATDATGAEVLNPGVYALAITGAGRYPIGSHGAIFNQATNTELSGPDGPGGLNPLIGWAGESQVGDYEVALDGTGYVDVPAPGVAALAGIAGLAALRRRR